MANPGTPANGPIHHSIEQAGRGESSTVAIVIVLLGILAAPVVRPAVTQFRDVRRASHTLKDRTLIYISLALSLSSLTYAAWVHSQGSDVLAMRALRQREAELVRSLAPKFATIYRDMLPNERVASKPPATLEELVDPLVKLMESLGDGAGSSTNKGAR